MAQTFFKCNREMTIGGKKNRDPPKLLTNRRFRT
ncbi:hypothetical protein J2046_003282 [Rhizobium petrolearium]|nr:hypothetical protein [Neorhizobium petrolearium]